MRILSITAGAANMYCGSCLRDNGLARGLMKLGHDVTLMPLYTPTRVDEENVSRDRVFLGGVSVYLEQHIPLFRRTPWLLDRVWDSTRFLSLIAKHSIAVNPQRLGALTVSTLMGERGHQRREVLRIVRHVRVHLADCIGVRRQRVLEAIDVCPAEAAWPLPVHDLDATAVFHRELVGEPVRFADLTLLLGPAERGPIDVIDVNLSFKEAKERWVSAFERRYLAAIFAAGRAYDQVRLGIAHNELPVRIGASHGGVSLGEERAETTDPVRGAHPADDNQNPRRLETARVDCPRILCTWCQPGFPRTWPRARSHACARDPGAPFRPHAATRSASCS